MRVEPIDGVNAEKMEDKRSAHGWHRWHRWLGWVRGVRGATRTDTERASEGKGDLIFLSRLEGRAKGERVSVVCPLFLANPP